MKDGNVTKLGLDYWFYLGYFYKLRNLDFTAHFLGIRFWCHRSHNGKDIYVQMFNNDPIYFRKSLKWWKQKW
jgi:hypothetical protein